MNEEMSKVVTGKTLYELCKALGIIPESVDRVRKFTLTAQVGALPVLEVEYYPIMPSEPTTKRFRVEAIEE